MTLNIFRLRQVNSLQIPVERTENGQSRRNSSGGRRRSRIAGDLTHQHGQQGGEASLRSATRPKTRSCRERGPPGWRTIARPRRRRDWPRWHPRDRAVALARPLLW